MIEKCPFCNSKNLVLLSRDTNYFICNNCGEDFEIDNDSEEEKEKE